MDVAWAHSRNDRGERDPLVTHLRDTAEQARGFADAFGAGDLAYWLGLWHDLGKFHDDWQAYLLAAEAWEASGRRGPRPGSVDHKAAGALLAADPAVGMAVLGLPIQGHHGGLGSRAAVQDLLSDPARRSRAEEALRRAREALSELIPRSQLVPPTFSADDRGGVRRHQEFFVRMLFSALVDADFLDTERHFDVVRSDMRGSPLTVAALWQRLQDNETEQRRAGRRTPGLVNDVRAEVLAACTSAARLGQGFFRLTVPTGGGKTRSGMAFALEHAHTHALRRVVVAVPFITIAEQTSGVLGDALDSPAPDDVTRELERTLEPGAVLQHFTGGLGSEGNFRQKLASENWDAPVIVTSTVQLFESLFSNRPSDCRKLHRLAKSVIILDEAQALPPNHLDPILDVLRILVRDYGATVVFSTATQPAFESIPGFAGLQAQEIVSGYAQHFDRLRRVRFTNWAEPTGWDAVATRMLDAPSALAVVNTRAHAAQLFDELRARAPEGSVFHLSTRMVQRHRLRVLDAVRARLREGLPCYLAATQMIEAGVDISFPLVLRALAPLDAIIQAAGRCNREGELGPGGGEVIVFAPREPGMPRGPYATGADLVAGILARSEDLAALDVQQRYWRDYFRNVMTDREGIQPLRELLDYAEVAKAFRMIEPSITAVVTSQDATGGAARAIEAIRTGRGGRHAMRSLQPFAVSLRQWEATRLERQALAREVVPGLYEWLGTYGDAGIELRG